MLTRLSKNTKSLVILYSFGDSRCFLLCSRKISKVNFLMMKKTKTTVSANE